MKNRLPLVIAVIVAVAAVIAVQSYVKRVEARSAEQWKGPKVICAKTDIPAGTVLELRMIAPRETPKQFITAQSIMGTQDNANLILGQKTKVAIKAGQAIQWSDLVTERRGGFESVIPAGERAFTVKMTGGIKGGLIQPGDHVDIIVNLAVPEARTGVEKKPEAAWRARSDVVNVVLLQNVTVLAVGDTFQIEPQGARSANDLTLAVTLPEAQLLMFAAQHGDLAAVLRKSDDLGSCKGERITFESLEKLIGDLDGVRARRIVEIQKGGRIEKVSVEDGVPTR